MGNMDMNGITISVEKFEEMIALRERVRIFSRLVRNSKYSIEREYCADVLDFALEEEQDVPFK